MVTDTYLKEGVSGNIAVIYGVYLQQASEKQWKSRP